MPRYTPHQYQAAAIDWLVDALSQGALGRALWLDPGLGKTSITLQTIYELRGIWGQAKRVLIIAPLRVIYSVWPAEVRKWGYPYSISIVHGTPSQKRKALDQKADLYLMNPEGVLWLEKELKGRQRFKPFDLTVIDESTKFKSWSAARTRALRCLVPILGQRVELTGTPAPNSYIDLMAQAYFLDGGTALCKNVTAFRNKYCFREVGNGFQRWVVRPGAEAAIDKAIAPLVLRMSALDHLDMPALVTNRIEIELPSRIMRAYRQLERELFAKLENGEELFASSAGAKYAKCRSIANGGAYVDDGEGRRAIHVHDSKVEAVADLLEELNGKSLLVAYLYDHDLERLQRAFPNAPVIKGGMSPKASSALIDKWNARQLPILFVQPQALSHGANMQAGGADVCWFALTDQPEIHTQFNARLWRQGQEGGQVRIHYLIAKRTVDEAVFERIQDKDRSQAALLRAVKEYRDRSYQEEFAA